MSSKRHYFISRKNSVPAFSRKLNGGVPALVIVDMQNYYLRKDSSYWRYFNALQPGCLDYIVRRCETVVIPNIRLLLGHFRKHGLTVLFLRLCGRDPVRNDLHPFFRETYLKGKRAGFDDVYPLADDPWAGIIDEIEPQYSEHIVDKTTFSPFTRTGFDKLLEKKEISVLVMTGLSTSQCVESTARDASDRGYVTIHIEDAQADYDETSHHSSLYSSQGVCGGLITSSRDYIKTGTTGGFDVRGAEGDYL
jgi:nicotinamidase-related amidase